MALRHAGPHGDGQLKAIFSTGAADYKMVAVSRPASPATGPGVAAADDFFVAEAVDIQGIGLWQTKIDVHSVEQHIDLPSWHQHVQPVPMDALSFCMQACFMYCMLHHCQPAQSLTPFSRT